MLCHLESVFSGLLVGFEGTKESHSETTEPIAVAYCHVKYCQTSLLPYLFLLESLAQSSEIPLPFSAYKSTATLLECMQTEGYVLCC
jgi:hypothetical protein